ncbi:MAG: hypothetical protein K8I82_12630 [Anaerolineae bacterium]|nr:hypothetical protein [Anaerolineae bacterium]
MSHHIEWYLEPHILFVRYEGDLTLQDFEGVNQTLKIYLDTVGHSFHTLSDFSGVRQVPTDLVGVSKAMAESLAQVKSVVVYGQSMVASVLTNSVAHLIHKPIFSLKDREGGLKKIAEIDPEVGKLL